MIGDSSMVESLISRGLVDVNARLPLEDRPPALVLAAAFGRAKIVDILLRANARVNEPDERGWTACHAAAQGDHCDVLALLLARQPNLAAVDVNGKTSFCFALKSCHNDDGRCALMLLEAGASLERADPFHLCRFVATSTAAIQALTTRGVVVRAIVASNGATPLHAAAGQTDVRVFHMLVNVCGIDVETRNDDGSASIHFGAMFENAVALRWLIEAGADVNVADNDGATPLHRANDFDCAVLLLAAGANVCARDCHGRTALHDFVANEVSELTVHALLAAGADLDAVDNDGQTSRHMLARRGWAIDPDNVEASRREIAKARIDFVRDRARQICIGLQSLRIDALQMCEVLQFACGAIAPLIPFHIWWKIATTVKHFQTNSIQ
jgi:ankyrin repeat protein